MNLLFEKPVSNSINHIQLLRILIIKSSLESILNILLVGVNLLITFILVGRVVIFLLLIFLVLDHGN